MKNLDKYLSLLSGEVDGLLLTSRYSRYYGAEYDIAEGAAVVSKNGCRYFTDSRYIEPAQDNIKDFEVIDIVTEKGYVGCLNKAIAELGIHTLGYEENYLTARELFTYEHHLNAKLVPMNDKISAFRDVKEEWELELMRKAQAIADKAFADLLPRIKVGMTELEVQAELIYCLYKNGAHGLSFDPIVISGPKTSVPHGVAGDRVIGEGEFITMDFGALYHGYCSDMTRTVAVGYVTEEMEKVYNIVLEAQLAALAVTKAGVPGCEIDAAARKVITDAGYGPYFGHGYGHGVGLEIHESPSPNGRNKEPIPENAVCSAEPGIYIPGKFGVRIEDVTIFKADGYENITFSPKNLIIL
jgi:Xaa-Pro aminopeptidase